MDDLILDLFLVVLAVFCISWLRKEAIKYFKSHIQLLKDRKSTLREKKTKIKEEPVRAYYSLDSKEFTKIAYKIAYRYHRTEEATVEGNKLTVIINSQSGLSSSTATMIFVLSGYDDVIGSFSLKDDNPNLNFEAPKHIAEKIKYEIRQKVGIVV